MRFEGAVAARCGERPPGEVKLAALLQPLLRRAPRAPELVVDGRAPAAVSGPTAAYRLLAALDLRRASPLATWVAEPAEALTALDWASTLLEGDAPGLLVACGRLGDGGWRAGGCLFAPDPKANAPARRGEFAGRPAGSDGFLSLALALVSPPTEGK